MSDLPQKVKLDLSNRDAELAEIAQFFEFGHLPEGQIRELGSILANHALWIAAVLPDSNELNVGLRKLLEAKDCFIRAAIAARWAGLEG
jgi:hypothetical protein